MIFLIHFLVNTLHHKHPCDHWEPMLSNMRYGCWMCFEMQIRSISRNEICFLTFSRSDFFTVHIFVNKKQLGKKVCTNNCARLRYGRDAVHNMQSYAEISLSIIIIASVDYKRFKHGTIRLRKSAKQRCEWYMLWMTMNHAIFNEINANVACSVVN